jgi:hypothetical protein
VIKTARLVLLWGACVFIPVSAGDSVDTSAVRDSASVSAALSDTSRLIPAAKPVVTAPVTAPATTHLKLVRRNFNGRQQVLLATGMMAFVLVMLTAAQQWNPR